MANGTLTSAGYRQGMTYNFFEGDWSGQCFACGTWLYAPTKDLYTTQYRIHTHSKDCLGGY